MKPPFEIDFSLSVKDYKNSVRAFHLKQRSTWISLSVTGVLFIYGLFLILNPDSDLSNYSIFALLLFPVILFAYLVFSPNRMAASVSQSDRYFAPQNWRVDQAGIKITNEYGELKFKWTDFIGVVENTTYLLLQYASNKNAFQIVPKRAFLSAEQEEAFRDLAKQNVKKAQQTRRK
ncbi:MAG: YcxB family protein [Anaerolineales bacterium]